MKKRAIQLIALLLTLCLTACSIPQQTNEPDITEMPDSAAKTEAAAYLLTDANYPDLPEEPSEAELYEADEAIYNSKNMTEEEKQEASSQLWDEFMDQSEAYWDAVQALKQETPTADTLADLQSFTTEVSGALLASPEGGNTVYSPANLYLALAMLAETTGSETRQEVLDLLGIPDVETLRFVSSSVWKQLYEDSAYSKTLLANSYWMNTETSFHQDVLDTLARDYYASSWQVPMGTPEADAAIQSWLNEHTGDFLKESVDGVETTPDILLLLVSSLYFQDQWRDEFLAGNNTEDDFTLTDGSASTTTFMHQSRHQRVWQEDGFTVASLPFSGQASMRFLLPDEGVSLDDLLTDPTALDFVTGDLEEGTEALVNWSVPKFDISATLELTDALKSLGIVRAFQPDSADFTPLTDEPLVYVSSVQHAARVMIDEEGCTAAAYTIIAEAAAGEFEPPKPVEMNLNRPFLFVITGLDGLPLFLGAVRNPTN